MTLIPLMLAVAALLMATRALQDEAGIAARLDRTCGATFVIAVRLIHERRLVEARLAQIHAPLVPIGRARFA